jgi:hypothetical protein
MREAARAIAQAVHGAHDEQSSADGTGRYRATVLRWGGQKDFALDLHGEDLELDEDDVTLGQSVRRYDADVGIEEGDLLVLLEVGDGDFSAVDVESDTEATGP